MMVLAWILGGVIGFVAGFVASYISDCKWFRQSDFEQEQLMDQIEKNEQTIKMLNEENKRLVDALNKRQIRQVRPAVFDPYEGVEAVDLYFGGENI